jgi:hypothetical protein
MNDEQLAKTVTTVMLIANRGQYDPAQENIL